MKAGWWLYRTRISTHSLPVEDDTRHVEDACLIGDDTVIVGYNKGPCQVSLIPVEDDQVRDVLGLAFNSADGAEDIPAASVPHRSHLQGALDRDRESYYRKVVS